MKRWLFDTFLIASFVMLSSTALGKIVADNESNTATYAFEINEENNAKFFSAIKNLKIKKLRVNSGGGDVEAAIKLALWIYNNKVDIEVIEYCLSSCANYLFTAAYRKIILPGAIVAWHGNYHHLKYTGLWRNDILTRIKRTRETRVQARNNVLNQVNNLVKLEQSFFKEIGVDQKICWIGKMPPYNVSNYYFLTVSDMHRFGVRNITLQKNYEKTNVKEFVENIVYLKLN